MLFFWSASFHVNFSYFRHGFRWGHSQKDRLAGSSSSLQASGRQNGTGKLPEVWDRKSRTAPFFRYPSSKMVRRCFAFFWPVWRSFRSFWLVWRCFKKKPPMKCVDLLHQSGRQLSPHGTGVALQWGTSWCGGGAWREQFGHVERSQLREFGFH